MSVVPTLVRCVTLEITIYFDVGILNRIRVEFVQPGCVTVPTDYVAIEKLAKEKGIAEKDVSDHLVRMSLNLFI